MYYVHNLWESWASVLLCDVYVGKQKPTRTEMYLCYNNVHIDRETHGLMNATFWTHVRAQLAQMCVDRKIYVAEEKYVIKMR